MEKVDDFKDFMDVLQHHSPYGLIVAYKTSAEEYMEHYAEDFHEWIDGVVYKMSSVSLNHEKITGYLRELFSAYFALTTSGNVVSAPFVMVLDTIPSRREPDLQIILGENQENITDTYMNGAADICIEVVSPSNQDTDYGAKFNEYEQGGVKEYWIIDPKRRIIRFNRLDEEGVYRDIPANNGIYETPLLPKLKIDTSVLWQKNMPNIIEVVNAVKKLVDEAQDNE